MPIKILSVFGTRPEAIKMAPLVKQLEKDENFKSMICVTGQHRDMLDSVLTVFNIVPDWDLNIMKEQQTLSYISAAIIEKLTEVLKLCQPDLVLVHGDTTTSFAAALAAFYLQIPVGHVEAGLRSGNKSSPFPEELNRTLTSRIADLHFAPTMANRDHLLKENITQGIYVTGNTVIDAMSYTIHEAYVFEEPSLNQLDFENKRTILLTAHRRENLGEPLSNICFAVREIAQSFSDVQFIFPVHKNPIVRQTVYEILEQVENVHLIEPVSVLDMHNLIARSMFVLTDSGGLQEEAPALGKPVLVLRSETERPEVIQSGGAVLVGVEKKCIVEMVSKLLTDIPFYESMKNAKNPYGDGTAAIQIARYIKEWGAYGRD